MRVLRPAGHTHLFSEDMQEKFWTTDWKITHQSDRGGYRFPAMFLDFAAPVEMRSYGLVAGIIQVPPSGEPIIQLSDANTAGGYPKIATVIEADLWRLGQAQLRNFIRFEEVTYDAAVDAMAPVAAYLAGIRRTADLSARSDDSGRDKHRQSHKEDANEDRSQLRYGRRLRTLPGSATTRGAHRRRVLRQHRLRFPCRRPGDHGSDGRELAKERRRLDRGAPGLARLMGFGRRASRWTARAEKHLIYQIGALQGIAAAAGHRVTHVSYMPRSATWRSTTATSPIFWPAPSRGSIASSPVFGCRIRKWSVPRSGPACAP